MRKFQVTQAHNIYIFPTKLSNSTDDFKMNQIEIKHYLEIMQEHVFEK